MSRHFRSSTTPGIQQRQEDSAEVGARSSEAEVKEVERKEGSEVVFKEQVRAHKQAGKARTSITIREAAVVVEEAADLAGETMTSRKETEIRLSLSDLAGL